MLFSTRRGILFAGLLLVSTAASGAAAFVAPVSPPAAGIPRGPFAAKGQQKGPPVSPTSLAVAGAGLELIDPSYNLAIGAFGIGLAGGFLEDLRDERGEKLLTAKPLGALAVIFTVFSLFLAFQTTTLRFAFGEDSFSLVQAGGASLQQENVVVGGENKWRYDSFKNYDFLPSRSFPVLVYFREDQTPVENREEVPIVVDTLEGQVHFFPAISNSKQLEEGFARNGCPHV